jgi:predicted secreted protein
MMVKKLVSMLCLFISIYPGGFCNAMNSGAEVNDKTLIEIKKQDNGKEFIVKSGDIICVELEEMGAAGYSWFVDSLNTEHIEMLSKKTKSISEGKLGASVLGEWLFRVKKKGSAEINMDHYRVWEGKEKATEHFSVKLLIK